MELPVLKIDGTESGKKVVLDEKVFGIEPNDHAIYLDVVQYLANRRQGTAKTKDRSEVAHSTKKLGRQKGGGGARHGSLKANIFVGGGRVFGPKPRVYDEPFTMEAPKTKEFMHIIEALKAGSRKVLFVLPENSTNIYLSSRNLPEVKVITVNELNTYNIMNANSMVLVDGVQDVIAERDNR